MINLFQILLGASAGIVIAVCVYMVGEIAPSKTEEYAPMILEKSKTAWIYILTAIVTIAVLIWTKNLIPALIAATIVLYAPYQVTYSRQQAKKRKVLGLLSSATELFADTYIVTKNIPKAMEAVGNSVADPVGQVFREAYSEYAFGTPLERAADNLARKLGISYGYIFANLLKSAEKQGDVIAPLFRNLGYKITEAQERLNFQTTEVNSVRVTNMLLLALPVPVYFFLSCKFSETSVFMESTPGHVLFTLWLLAIILWMLIDRLIIDG